MRQPAVREVARRLFVPMIAAVFLVCAPSGCARDFDGTHDSRLRGIDAYLRLPPGRRRGRRTVACGGRSGTSECPAKRHGRDPPSNEAVSRRRYDLAVLLLQRGADPNQLAHGYAVPLVDASSVGDTEMVKILLRFGANVDLAAPRHGVTALLAATRRNKISTVRVLLASDARTDIRQRDGATALEIAESLGNAEIRDLLVDAGARPGKRE
jgi:Ankyrin repeats (3 copies)